MLILSQSVTQWMTSQPERFKSSIPSLQDSTEKYSFSSLRVTLTQNLCQKQQGHKDKNHVIPLIRINVSQTNLLNKKGKPSQLSPPQFQEHEYHILKCQLQNNCSVSPNIVTMRKHGFSLSSTHCDCKVRLHLGCLDTCTFLQQQFQSREQQVKQSLRESKTMQYIVVLTPPDYNLLIPPNTLLLLKPNGLAKKWIFYNPATQFPFNFLKITTSVLWHDHIFSTGG